MKAGSWLGLAAVALAIVVEVVGCSASVETAGSGGAGGANGAGGASHPSGGGSDMPSGGGSPNPAGGIDPPTCTAAQHSCVSNSYCSFGGTNCGSDGLAGVCLIAPDCSNSGGQEVCGCDGKIYAFPCLAFAAGVDVTVASACTPPPDTFACGTQFCSTGSFCNLIDHGGTPDHLEYACIALPPACGTAPTCDCLAGFPACATDVQCSADASGNLTLQWGYCD